MMQIFAIADIKDRKLVLDNLEQHYNGKFYDPGEHTIFLASDGETSREVATKIGLSNQSPKYTSGVVLLISGYWGHHNPQLWEWLQAKGSSNGF